MHMDVVHPISFFVNMDVVPGISFFNEKYGKSND